METWVTTPSGRLITRLQHLNICSEEWRDEEGGGRLSLRLKQVSIGTAKEEESEQQVDLVARASSILGLNQSASCGLTRTSSAKGICRQSRTEFGRSGVQSEMIDTSVCICW
jgi:hypothetical protein